MDLHGLDNRGFACYTCQLNQRNWKNKRKTNTPSVMNNYMLRSLSSSLPPVWLLLNNGLFTQDKELRVILCFAWFCKNDSLFGSSDPPSVFSMPTLRAFMSARPLAFCVMETARSRKASRSAISSSMLRMPSSDRSLISSCWASHSSSSSSNSSKSSSSSSAASWIAFSFSLRRAIPLLTDYTSDMERPSSSHNIQLFLFSSTFS